MSDDPKEIVSTDDFDVPNLDVLPIKTNENVRIINPTGIVFDDKELEIPSNGKLVIQSNPPTVPYIPSTHAGVQRPRDLAEARERFGDWGTRRASEHKMYFGDRNEFYVCCHEQLASLFDALIDKLSGFDILPLIQSIKGYECCALRNESTPRHNNMSPQGYGLGFSVNDSYNLVGKINAHPYGLPSHLTSKGLDGYSLYQDHVIVTTAEAVGFVWAGRSRWLTGTSNTIQDPALFVYAEEW